MENFPVTLLALLIGIALGAVPLLILLRTQSEAHKTHTELLEARHSADLAQVRQEESVARAAAEASLALIREQLATAEEQYRAVIAQSKAEQAAENKILTELAPVKDSLGILQRTVTALELQRAKQHGEISQQLTQASEAEERLRLTAEKLASALADNSTRGVWGEVQLRKLVESAGLINRVDFSIQTSITAESGQRRPDLVVNLPGGKQIAVDAKVPYTDYIQANAIPANASGDQANHRKKLLASHATKLRKHVDALAEKSYWTGLESSPEFTIAFIPNDPLLAAALVEDPALLEYAFARRIALASPVSLWAVLKTVAFTWQQDVLTEDAKHLFDVAKELHSRLATLANHAEKLRRAIESTVTHYNSFANSFEQRVLVSARKLDTLDETRIISEQRPIETTPRPLTQSE